MLRPATTFSAGSARSAASAAASSPAMPLAFANATPTSSADGLPPGAAVLRKRAREQPVAAAAGFDDRLVEQALRERRGQEHQHRRPARRLAEHRHVARIAAERRDVRLHPAQRRELVHVAVVAERALVRLLRQRGVREEPEPADAVVEAHEHDAALRELRAVVDRGRAAAVDEAAAVDPHHHRQRRRRPFRRTPDVEDEAVLVRWRAERRGVAGERQLRAVVAVRGGRPHARPRLGRLRRAPA